MAALEGLIDRHRSGFNLERAFYTAPEIFEAEVERFLCGHWVLAGHASQVASAGDYFLFSFAGYSIIIVRGKDGEIRALHNTCRHRGARICEQTSGSTKSFRCKYHSWNYALDGSLLGWRHMPDHLDKEQFGLRQCAVEVFYGVIFVSIEPDKAPDFAELTRQLRPHWERYELDKCKVAAQELYILDANWKLAIENNLECYHCLSAHPQYTAANAFVRADEKVSPEAAESFAVYHQEWRENMRARGVKVGATALKESRGQLSRAGTWPIAPDIQTGSNGGKPVAPLLGGIDAYDESVTSGGFGFLSYMLSYCDYALMMTYAPQSQSCTHVHAKWLVREGACEGVDYDAPTLRWLWDETTLQDKALIELNAAGVASPAYVPGPYSNLEWLTADFIERYLKLMK